MTTQNETTNNNSPYVHRGAPPPEASKGEEVVANKRNPSITLNVGDWTRGILVSVREAQAMNAHGEYDVFPIYTLRVGEDEVDLPAGRWDLQAKLAQVPFNSDVFIGCVKKEGRSFIHRVRIIKRGDVERNGSNNSEPAATNSSENVPF
jgi:hypothetical protein